MKKVLYILFHRSVFVSVALLAQVTALLVMVFSFSAYTEIFYWCCITLSVAAAVAIVGSSHSAFLATQGITDTQKSFSGATPSFWANQLFTTLPNIC